MTIITTLNENNTKEKESKNSTGKRRMPAII